MDYSLVSKDMGEDWEAWGESCFGDSCQGEGGEREREWGGGIFCCVPRRVKRVGG